MQCVNHHFQVCCISYVSFANREHYFFAPVFSYKTYTIVPFHALKHASLEKISECVIFWKCQRVEMPLVMCKMYRNVHSVTPFPCIYCSSEMFPGIACSGCMWQWKSLSVKPQVKQTLTGQIPVALWLCVHRAGNINFLSCFLHPLNRCHPLYKLNIVFPVVRTQTDLLLCPKCVKIT